MDNNVSKKTFLHKFFKLRFNNEETSISVKELLKQMLLSTLNLSQQSWNIPADPLFANNIMGSKIVLLHTSIESISSSHQIEQVLSASKPTPIMYSCSIALLLASSSKKEPQVIAKELINSLILLRDKSGFQSEFNLTIEIMKSGLINFYLESESIAIWLNKSLALFNRENTICADNLFSTKPLNIEHPNLLPAQYTHARCCTLLRLAEREKLVMDKENNQLAPCLDEWGNLWLKKEIELILLRQLFLVTDSFARESVDWHKIILNLSETTAVFLAECRFIGQIQQENPERAIARLKLIAIVQYWLQRILVEKLNVAAPTSL